jgi:hypothetical protein
VRHLALIYDFQLTNICLIGSFGQNLPIGASSNGSNENPDLELGTAASPTRANCLRSKEITADVSSGENGGCYTQEGHRTVLRPRASTYCYLVEIARQETMGAQTTDPEINQVEATLNETNKGDCPRGRPGLEVLRTSMGSRAAFNAIPQARMKDHPAFRHEPGYFRTDIQLETMWPIGPDYFEPRGTGSTRTLDNLASSQVSETNHRSIDTLLDGSSYRPGAWTNTGAEIPRGLPAPTPSRYRTPHYVCMCIDLNARRGENWKGSRWCLRSFLLLIPATALLVLVGL